MCVWVCVHLFVYVFAKLAAVKSSVAYERITCVIVSMLWCKINNTLLLQPKHENETEKNAQQRCLNAKDAAAKANEDSHIHAATRENLNLFSCCQSQSPSRNW